MLNVECFLLPVCNSTFTPSGSSHLVKFRKCVSQIVRRGPDRSCVKQHFRNFTKWLEPLA